MIRPALLVLIGPLLLAPIGYAQAVQSPSPRYAAGSIVTEPIARYSNRGALQLNLTYLTRTDSSGNVLYCFVDENGAQSPTLHVNPGDQLIINFKNGLSPSSTSNSTHAMPGMVVVGSASSTCGAIVMNSASANIHYHGTNTPPVCHQDDVIKTLVNAGESFQYNVQFPPNEPPRPLLVSPARPRHSRSCRAGRSIRRHHRDGIQNVNPAVTGLPARVLMIRDNPVPGNPTASNVPAWDLSLNYIPVPYPHYTPAVIPMKPGEKQLWRVVNASADTIIDLQLQYDGTVQPLQVIALDGVPTGSQDGAGGGSSIVTTDVLLAPAARVEFIITGPSSAVQNATLLTLNIDTGPDGDNDPQRPLAAIKASLNAPEPPIAIPPVSGPPNTPRFGGLSTAVPTATRHLYFSEVLTVPSDPNSPTNFFITVNGATPTLFSPTNPPAIVTQQGAVEDWIIENHALENHEFHMHQIHFLVLEQNGVPVPNGQYLDMINVPYWSGTGPYPSVKVRMDFRGPDIGDFVYHCHILGHEDSGMMAIIRVLP